MDKETVSLPLADARMLMSWMDDTFGNDDGLDWQDEDAAAVGDALNKAIERFKAMRAACASSESPALPEQPTGTALKALNGAVWGLRNLLLDDSPSANAERQRLIEQGESVLASHKGVEPPEQPRKPVAFRTYDTDMGGWAYYDRKPAYIKTEPLFSVPTVLPSAADLAFAASSESPALPADEWLTEAEELIALYAQAVEASVSEGQPPGTAKRRLAAVTALLSHLRLRLPEGSEPPVAWRRKEGDSWIYYEGPCWDDLTPLYTHPIAQAGDATNAADGVSPSDGKTQTGDAGAVLSPDAGPKQTVTRLMRLAVAMRHAPSDGYDDAYKCLQNALYAILAAANGHQAPCGSDAADGARVGATDQGEKA